VDVPLGDYTIMNSGPSPFTNVALTMTINGVPYLLVRADTLQITGTGQFIINASASSLLFSTANANGTNPADLVFSDATSDRFSDPLHAVGYGIGTDGDPAFENAVAGTTAAVSSVSFPFVFGTASVPDTGPTLLMFGIGLSGIAMTSHALSKRPAKSGQI
jgi:hypothetical protein